MTRTRDFRESGAWNLALKSQGSPQQDFNAGDRAPCPFDPPTNHLTSSPAIELRDVSLSFENKRVLTRVSLLLPLGETLVLLGVTGSGKSVLLKVMLGLIKPDEGQVLIQGEDIVPLPEELLGPIRQHMGIVFQEGALFDSLSVFENVAFRLREEHWQEEAIDRRVREVLSFVEMDTAIERMPAELSGGMRRRVAIARAIASEPCIMLYDSPTGGLDPVTSHTINVLVVKLRDVQHVTSVVVTHRLQDAVMLVKYGYSPQRQTALPREQLKFSREPKPTRFVVMRDGEVYFHGSAEEFTRTSDSYLLKFLP
jgi:phospholipid/cholesterol/gamma-HCH transport system ATP-binding protein